MFDKNIWVILFSSTMIFGCGDADKGVNNYSVIGNNLKSGSFEIVDITTGQTLEEGEFSSEGNESIIINIEVSREVSNFSVIINDAIVNEYYNDSELPFTDEYKLVTEVHSNNEELLAKKNIAINPITTLASCFPLETELAFDSFSDLMGFDILETIPQNLDAQTSLPEESIYNMFISAFSYMAFLHFPEFIDPDLVFLNSFTLVNKLCLDAEDGTFNGKDNTTPIVHGDVTIEPDQLTFKLIDSLEAWLESEFNNTPYFGEIVPFVTGPLANADDNILFGD
jgi:hypothetical protein